MPFEEVPHTADWSLRIWAADLPGLFSEAARGMIALAGTHLASSSKIKRNISLSAPDLEGLLVSFLSELLFIGEQEKLAFDDFRISIKGEKLEAEMIGAPILSIDKIIKAVTYHNLRINHTAKGFETEIVFDV